MARQISIIRPFLSFDLTSNCELEVIGVVMVSFLPVAPKIARFDALQHCRYLPVANELTAIESLYATLSEDMAQWSKDYGRVMRPAGECATMVKSQRRLFGTPILAFQNA